MRRTATTAATTIITGPITALLPSHVTTTSIGPVSLRNDDARVAFAAIPQGQGAPVRRVPPQGLGVVHGRTDGNHPKVSASWHGR